MANIDQLSIEITSDSHKAEAAINDLVKGLTNLENTLNKLDVSKITQFTNAVTKLSNIGANTNTTTKAIKGMASEIASSFGIRTKKGISDITEALMQLYEVNKNQKLGFDVGGEYDTAVNKVQKAIEANYKYKTSVDSTTQSVKDYVMATNKAGQTIGMAGMAQEYGENFKEMSKVLGGAFKNKLDSTKEGVSDLAEYLSEMNSQLGTQFDVDNVEKGFAQLVETVRSAKSEILDYSEATKQGLLSNNASYDATVSALMQIEDLLREQEKYGAASGLGGVINAFQQLSNYSDLSGLTNSLKEIKSNTPTDTAKAVSDIGDSADKATAQVEKLNTVLSQSKTVIEGNEIKEHGFTMTNAPEPKNVQYPPAIIEQAQAYEEKLLPAIIDTQNQIDVLFERMMSLSSTEAVYDAITQKFIEMKTQLMEMNGAISGDKWVIPEFKGSADFARQQTGWISNIKPEVVEGYFYEIEDSANKCLPAIINVGETALVTSDHFKALGQSVSDCSEVLKASANDSQEAADKIQEASEGVEKSTEKADKASKKTPKIEGYDLLRNLEEISKILKELSEAFEKLSEKSLKAFNIMITPLKHFAGEYIEKFEHMAEGVKKFQKKVQAHMTKLSAFWKRTMKTFTFMLVRKAITAIIKEVGNAIQSLAMYSNAMGTAFNTDISQMVADFQYLGRSIVSIFAPLLNFVIPIIDAIVDRIATLLSYIGMLIAALGGSTSFTKAKKNVSNYAESLDSASKSAKKLTMGIDELNILNDSSGGGGAKPYDGWEDAWEDVKIPDWILNLSDKIKDFIDKLLAPLKAAWERVKKRFMEALRYMKTQLLKMFSSIIDAFLKVWSQAKTIKLFENLLNIIADIMATVGALAQQFRKAWDEADRGVRIFEGIRDIFLILSQHLVNVTDYMVSWANNLDFGPLLDSIIGLLDGLEKVADFLGGVFEDVMRLVVFKYIKWLIEEGLPHLNKTIKEIIDSFNFKKIQDDLVPLEKAFERLLEHIEEGTTNAFGNLGKQIAEFTNSEKFTNFMQRIADIMDLISAEDVEKVLTGLGTGILHIADSLVSFVNSDSFMAFLETMDKWLENVTAEDIANGLEKIAKAILMFKFAEFASAGLSGFFKFFVLLKGLTDIGTIAKNMSLLGEGLGAVGAEGAAAGAGGTAAAGGIAAIAAPAALVAAAIAAVTLALYSMTKSFGGVTGLLDRLKEEFNKVSERVLAFAQLIGLDDKIAALKESISSLCEKLGGLKDFWDIIITAVGWVASAFFSSLLPAISVVIDTVTNFIDILSSLFEILGGVGELIVGVFTFDGDKIKEGFDSIISGFLDFISVFNVSVLGKLAADIVNWAQGEESALGNWLSSLKEFISEKVSTIISSIVQFFNELPEKLGYALGLVIGTFVKWGADVVEWIATNVPLFIEQILSFFVNLAEKLLELLITTITSFDQWKSTLSTWIDTHIPKTIEELVAYFKEIGPKLWALGTDIVSGLINGINDAWSKLKGGVADFCGNFIQGFKDAFKINSPSKETEDIGDFLMQGLFKPFSETNVDAIKTFANNILNVFKQELTGDKFTAIGKQMVASLLQPLAASSDQFALVINKIFVQVTTDVKTGMQVLGVAVMDLMQTFGQIYILPFFNMEMWQPLFDNLLNMVFIPFFETFRTWFTEEAMTPWWEEDLLFWFADDKWDEDIFDPLMENIQGHWDEFSSWWDTTLTNWWETQVIPWFEKEKWKEQFMNVHDTLDDVLKKIHELLKDAMDRAKEMVLEACDTMQKALEDVGNAIEKVLNSLKGFNGFDGKVTFDFGGVGEFAAGGFPAYGSLFVAGEAGPEFVSNIGGRTGVVSNDEITGIADAVYTTGYNEAELLGQLVTIARAVLDKDPVVIGDREIARMANSGQSKLGMSIIT